jgi:hypothetical protein
MTEVTEWAVWELVKEAVSSPEERREDRQAAAAKKAKEAVAKNEELAGSEAAFMARVNGHAARNPLAEASAEPVRDRHEAARKRAAADILRQYGLQDVIQGVPAAFWDANMGILESPPDEAQRAEMDRRYEFERSERRAEERRRAVDGYRERLDARFR